MRIKVWLRTEKGRSAPCTDSIEVDIQPNMIGDNPKIVSLAIEKLKREKRAVSQLLPYQLHSWKPI